MTSSLVGSEMCIRDRQSIANCLTPGRDTTGRQSPDELRKRHGKASINAVSYTHLTLPTICSV
eukprot:624044-Prorocentrum_lima.AAC.1